MSSRSLAGGVWATAVGAFVGGWCSTSGHADDGDLRLHSEPIDYTDVADALDGEDLFDLNVRLGFESVRTVGDLQREVFREEGGVALAKVGRFEHVRNRLILGLDVGVHRDLALLVKVPLVLSDDRSVRAGFDSSIEGNPLVSPGTNGNETVFSVPFNSPSRSGVEELRLGAAYSISNQFRAPHFPTWVLIAEGVLALGPPMRACLSEEPTSEEQERCVAGDDPGISRGVNGFRVESRVSRRIHQFEPYGGLALEATWPGTGAKLFEPGLGSQGFGRAVPPREVSATGGVAFIPWEHRARSQRLTLDFRGVAEYFTAGHGYSPVFDALGTSSHASLRSLNRGCPTCASDVEFVGLTDMQSRSRLSGRLGVEVQAARYVRFILTGALLYSTPYFITFAEPCASVSGETGSCPSLQRDPHYRAVIDAPGNRFRMGRQLGMDVSAAAMAQF